MVDGFEQLMPAVSGDDVEGFSDLIEFRWARF
jgi:hypothetical protein